MMIMMMKVRMSWVPFLADNPPSTDLFSLFSFNNKAADISLLLSFVCVLSPLLMREFWGWGEREGS